MIISCYKCLLSWPNLCFPLLMFVFIGPKKNLVLIIFGTHSLLLAINIYILLHKQRDIFRSKSALSCRKEYSPVQTVHLFWKWIISCKNCCFLTIKFVYFLVKCYPFCNNFCFHISPFLVQTLTNQYFPVHSITFFSLSGRNMYIKTADTVVLDNYFLLNTP